MVRILSCHHFRGQRIGRCDEAVAVAVAGDAVIVALDHQINVYGRSDQPAIPHSPALPQVHSITKQPGPGTSPTTTTTSHGAHDIGASYVFQKSPNLGSPPAKNQSSISSSVESIESDTDLRLSHSFSTIDLIEKMSYNEKGKYVMCLEKRDHSTTTCVRAYFHWQTDHSSKPMRARIAGLVSPTGAEPEDDSLMMVEIPSTSSITAIASCNLTGHIACLSAECIVNLFVFREKEVTGRIKVHYYDFDRMYAVELPGFIPDEICFLSNYIACINAQKVHLIRLKKDDGFGSPSSSASSLGEISVQSNTHHGSGLFNSFHRMGRAQTPTLDKVVFDPKNETCKVHLNTIIRANRKRRSPSVLFHEEFSDEITSHHSKLIFSASNPGILIEDVLRVSVAGSGNAGGSHSANNALRLLKIGMHPIRVKDHLGGIALIIATQKEGHLYHLPSKRGCQIVRVTTYPFTANLINFAFDSLFFHALTETGLETYTTRSLFYAIKDIEGFKTFVNDCPFQEEAPSLVGIRPFVNVRKMSCNSSCLCLLACATNPNGKNSTSPPEESSWTIYTLDLPDIEMIYDDMLRTAQLQAETNPESYFTLLCEAHMVLRLHINSHPDSEVFFAQRYKETCKLIGLAYLKSAWLNVQNPIASIPIAEVSDSSPSNFPSTSSSPPSELAVSTAPPVIQVSEEVVDRGITYLLMGRCGVQEIFSPENWTLCREPQYIPGFVRLIEVVFLKTNGGNADHQKLSPTLAPVVVEFLANNGSQILVELVIRQPFIRECNSKRLLNVLQHITETKQFSGKETLAYLLTLVTVGGVDSATRTQFKDLLLKTKLNEFSENLSKEIIFETRNQQTFLTDLAVCLAASDCQHILTEKIANLLTNNNIAVSLAMFAFAQAVNVNSDPELQHSITKSLTKILELYLSEKYKNSNNPGYNSVEVSEDDKRAIFLLVRTYLSNINSAAPHVINPSSNQTDPIATTSTNNDENTISSPAQGSSTNRETTTTQSPVPQTSSIIIVNDVKTQVATLAKQEQNSGNMLQKNQIFGSIFSSVNFLMSMNSPGGTLTPQSQSIVTSPLINSDDCRENFIKLLSLLGNQKLATLEGVKEIVVSYLSKNASQVKSPMNPTLLSILQILSETPEKAVNLLISKQPTTLMLFAKETFGKDTAKWRTLVGMLKTKVGNSNTTEADVYSTILESVFLHLANSLSPSELEQVLDKETEESNKFHGICKRVELANTYANMVITVSSEYLSHTHK